MQSSRRIILLLGVVCFCFFGASRLYAEPKQIIFYDEYPPFSFQKNGEAQGLWVDLIEAILTDMQVPYELQIYPFKRALHSAKNGDGVVVGVVKNEQRTTFLDYSEPFYVEKNLLWMRKGHAFKFTNVEDLKGYSLGIKLGWSYGDEFDHAKEAELFSIIDGDTKQLYALLDAKRLDAVVDNDLAAQRLIPKLNLSHELESLSEPLLLANIYLATQKGRDPEFLAAFNRSLKKLKSSNRLAEIQARFRETMN
ncbi:substrate-binding periplasmic protein [Litoribrevibacter euphylliae]|uniref:Substrate-binding periplasmic protein n=1 Tax=Litoribrevibacter euphylliae TaxID=1834034 RepID=A0ABV7HBF1_9GAMM